MLSSLTRLLILTWLEKFSKNLISPIILADAIQVMSLMSSLSDLLCARGDKLHFSVGISVSHPDTAHSLLEEEGKDLVKGFAEIGPHKGIDNWING